MSYQCEQCSESSTIGDAANALIKVGLILAVGYVVVTFRSQLKEIVGQALAKGQKHLAGKPLSGKAKSKVKKLRQGEVL